MWRRTYLLLLLVRVYFALSPSYLHPDEVFQGPEVIAGSLFPFPVHRTWEWTSDHPIRSVFPLWLFYGLPMSLLKSVWTKDDGTVEPMAIYYSLRLVMFILSFVLEDWAIYELVHSPRRRAVAVMLVASSYVTWTFQTHTFSNSIETLLVLWSLVLIDRIVKVGHRTSIASCLTLGFLLVLGLFNRITFPAFVLIPGMRLLPHFLQRPASFCLISASIAFWILVAVATDTAYYTGAAATASYGALFTCLQSNPVISIRNNIMYNTQTSNLAQHGIHPHYQHIIVNLPQLLGPAVVLMLTAATQRTGSRLKALLSNTCLTSAATGTLLLSVIPHQEPRFLLPCIPLLLTCLHLPSSQRWRQIFWVIWIAFNIILSVLMGIYHQGGVIPAQIAMPTLLMSSLNITQSKANNVDVFWWRTYPPPTYLLGTNHNNPITASPLNISTTALMGLNQSVMQTTLSQRLPACQPSLLDRISDTLSLQAQSDVYLAAPLSAWRLPKDTIYPPTSNFTLELQDEPAVRLLHQATFRNHINLDDMDFGDDGVWPTLHRVVGRRGLGVWRVERICPDRE